MLTRQHSQSFEVIPAVDLLGEEAVRLERGAFDRIVAREADPVTFVRRLVGAGARLLHVVDLDGARSGRSRPELVRRLAAAAAPAAIQASGGVRSLSDFDRLLDAGAARVVVGTAAFGRAGALELYAEAFGDRLVVAIDVRDGRLAIHGWTGQANVTAEEAARRCAATGVARLLCTAVDRDGTLAGPDVELMTRVRDESGLPVLAAGGIGTDADLTAVRESGCEGAIVGRALLDGRLPLAILGAQR